MLLSRDEIRDEEGKKTSRTRHGNGRVRGTFRSKTACM
jgi:hypothetical protein